MSKDPSYRIAVIPGDGIGVEVTAAALEVLRAAQRLSGGFALDCTELPAGAFCYKQTGEALPRATVDEAERSDAILLGACGWPEIRYPDGTEIRPQVELRFLLDLYAGVRPIRHFPGTPGALANPERHPIDFVVIRESTEGLFSSKGTVHSRDAAAETLLLTRHGTERLMRYGYGLARTRKAKGHPGRLTCVDKANVFQAFAFFRGIYDEVGLEFTDVEKDYCYVDAMALNLVRKPWAYDVMLMENMFGDILSDLAAGLVGGMGMAPSGDIGDEHAVFQPSHGTAPDIAGKGLANPVAMVLSAAMLCEHLADKRHNPALERAARLIEAGVEAYLASGQELPGDLGGRARTGEVTEGIVAAMEAHRPGR
jgi:3-isopropylmalate dehydrogenase